jgi:hypothetical protein
MRGDSKRFLANSEAIFEDISRGETVTAVARRHGLSPNSLNGFLSAWAETKTFVIRHENKRYVCEDFVPHDSTLSCDGNCPAGDCTVLRIATTKAMSKFERIT